MPSGEIFTQRAMPLKCVIVNNVVTLEAAGYSLFASVVVCFSYLTFITFQAYSVDDKLMLFLF